MGIDKFVLPSTITDLTISLKFTKLEHGVIPNSVKILKMIEFNTITFSVGSLPDSITNLIIHSKMIEYDPHFTFPVNIEQLFIMSDTTDKNNNKAIISKYQLPSTLKQLKEIRLRSFEYSTIIGPNAFCNLSSLIEFEMYNQNVGYDLIKNLNLPSSLKKVSIILPKIKDKIIKGFIPHGVTSLTLGYEFTLGINSLPYTITELSFENNNKPIEPNSIPNSVQSLYITGKFNHPLNTSNLPCNLKELKFESNGTFDHPIDQLPTSLKLLKLPKRYLFTNQISTIPQSVLDITQKYQQ